MQVSAAHAVTGRGAHNWGGTEIVVQELKVEPLLHWAYEPSLVGAEKEWIVNRTSGMWTVQDKLQQLGLHVDREKIPLVWQAIVDDVTVRHRALTDDEIRAICARITGK